MKHSPEELEQISAGERPEEKEVYTPRPKVQLVIAWALIAIVLFAFVGMCYWMIMYGRV